MRIAFFPDASTVNTFYRCTGPMLALGRRGHELRQLDERRPWLWRETLEWCEVLHMHRICDGGAVKLLQQAKDAGAAVVWDDDDDLTRIPRTNVGYRDVGGLRGARRLALRQKLFEFVDLATTPSQALAESFRSTGASEVRVIENYVIEEHLTDRELCDGQTIGWIAGKEHHLDLERLPLRDALERLLAAHPRLRVTTVGIGLGLDSERYRHLAAVPFPHLIKTASAFAIGIAPLSPAWRINHARSNVKVKEYAAAGVPWLASPIGPYAGLGERQGGRLVADDRWYEELEALVVKPRARRRLAKRAARWGREQTIARHAHLWEEALARALDRARGGG